VREQDAHILDGRDQVILDLLTPEPTPASSFDGNTPLTDHRNLLHYFLFKTSDLGILLCSSREPKQLLLHLTKRSHGCQRVHIVPPLHDLSALDGNDRDEPVVV